MAINLRDIAVFAAEPVDGQIHLRDLAVYAAQQEPPQPTVRKVGGAVLVDDVRGLKLRAARMVASASVRLPDFSKDGQTTLLAKVNAEWNLTLTLAKVSIENPRVLAGDDAFDSLIDLRSLLGSKYIGTMVLRYRRYDLSRAFQGKDTAGFTITDDTTVLTLLPTINSQYNLALTASDVVDGPVHMADGVITLTAGPTSIWFRPGTQIQLGTPAIPSLDSAIALGDLTGFEPA